jgi:thymidylate synthase (FAD)
MEEKIMKVELLSHFGDDLMVANVARVSYDKEVAEFGDKDAKLLRYLAQHKHTTPFRHPQLQFRIECPIYVERQLFTHQIGWARNSISGRYVDFSDDYDPPTQYRLQSKDSKQGSAGDVDNMLNEAFTDKVKKLIRESKKLYEVMIDFGISKEQARCHLPLCLTTKFIWTGSLHAFMHLCSLRLKPDAQQETRLLVADMLEAVRGIEGQPFKHSLAAWE